MENRSDYYKYKIISFDMLLPDREPININNINIGDIQIEKEYDSAFLPIFSMEVFFETDLYYLLIQNKNTVRFRLRMDNYIVQENSESVKFNDTVIDDIFVAYITEDDPNINKDLYEKAKEKSDGNDTLYAGTTIDLFLFKESDMIASRKHINAIISSGTMNDTVTFLLSKSGIKKLLMTNIQNNEIYKEIVLLPTTTIQNMIYLEKQYGFYENGAMFFFDLDATYLIPKNSKTTAYRTGEYLTTMILCYKSTGAPTVMSGTFKDNINKMYSLYVNTDNIFFQSKSLTDEQITGNDLTVVDTLTDKITKVLPDVDDRDSGNKKVILNNLSNKYLPTMIENAKVENDHQVMIVLYDFDIMALTPNKKMRMVFEDTAVQKLRGGNYRMSSAYYFLKKQGGEYSISGKVLLKKSI